MKTHYGPAVCSRASLGRNVLRVVLAFALVTLGIPAPASAAHGSTWETADYYFENSDHVYHVDYSDMLVHRGAAPDDSGQFSVTIARAVFPGEQRNTGTSFVLDPALPGGGVVTLGQSPEEVERLTGRSLRSVAGWEEVVTWTVTGTGDGVTTTYRVGTDYVSLTVPRDAFGQNPERLPADSRVVVEANGIVTELDTAFVLELEEAIRLTGEPPATFRVDTLDEISTSFRDLPSFVNGVSGLVVAEEKARTEGPLALMLVPHDLSSRSCWSPCISCVGSVVASIALYIGLISACGAALVTGGATAIGCIMAFIGLQASHLMVLGSCSRCVECGNR